MLFESLIAYSQKLHLHAKGPSVATDLRMVSQALYKHATEVRALQETGEAQQVLPENDVPPCFSLRCHDIATELKCQGYLLQAICDNTPPFSNVSAVGMTTLSLIAHTTGMLAISVARLTLKESSSVDIYAGIAHNYARDLDRKWGPARNVAFERFSGGPSRAIEVWAKLNRCTRGCQCFQCSGPAILAQNDQSHAGHVENCVENGKVKIEEAELQNEQAGSLLKALKHFTFGPVEKPPVEEPKPDLNVDADAIRGGRKKKGVYSTGCDPFSPSG